MAHKVIMDRAKRQVRKIRSNYINELEKNAIPKYVDLVMAEYDTELVGAVTDRRSRTNPIFYRDEFMTALENFDYLDQKNNTTTTISLPDIDTFPWGVGRLRVIENILEGIIGNYIEVDEEQYIGLFDKRPILDPYDKTVPRKQRIYLLRWNSNVNRRWNEVFPRETPVSYPFSNLPAVDIFGRPNMQFKEDLAEWMPDIIRKSIKEMPK